MTPEEIQELINSSIAAALESTTADLLSAVDSKNQGLAASLTKEIKKLQSKPAEAPTDGEQSGDEPNSKLTLKALKSQLEQLQAEREAERQAAFNAKKTAAISKLVSSQPLTQPSVAQKLFELNYGSSLKEEGDRWFVENADGTVAPVEQVFSTYLKSDEGKFLLPPSGSNGSGSAESRKTVAAPTSKPDAANPFGSAAAKLIFSE
jgi:hypothetical protein